jgi:DNA-binding NtrC family response regulator
MAEVLLTFVGYHDPYHKSSLEGEELKGPILYLLGLREFQKVCLFTAPNTYALAEQTADAITRTSTDIRVEIVTLDITDPIDYGQILAGIRKAFTRISRGNPGAQYSIATSSGTPQMHACWLMLASSGEIPARLLQARPPQFVSTDRPAVQEIDLRPYPDIGGFLAHPAYAMKDVPDIEIPRTSRSTVSRLASRVVTAPQPDFRNLRDELQIIGEHELFLGALERAASFAAHSAPVLITGETGTGKELVARFVHRASGRPAEKFVAVNCAALPSSLAESLLFGHKRGAFTGATEDQKGKFVQANGGTLFLDEIGELPPEVQAKLLRVLEDGVVEPIGSSSGVRVKVRIIAATNRRLREEVKEKRFREDLFYRIEVGTVSLPPLRDRRSDIPLLALWGLNNINSRLKTPKRLSQEAVDRLSRHDWPGNVRSLMNVMERAAISVRGEVLESKDLQFSEETDSAAGRTPGGAHGQASGAALFPDPAEGFHMDEFIDQARRHLITRALEMANGNKTVAASLLGITPQAIHNFLRRG